MTREDGSTRNARWAALAAAGAATAAMRCRRRKKKKKLVCGTNLLWWLVVVWFCVGYGMYCVYSTVRYCTGRMYVRTYIPYHSLFHTRAVVLQVAYSSTTVYLDLDPDQIREGGGFIIGGGA